MFHDSKNMEKGCLDLRPTDNEDLARALGELLSKVVGASGGAAAGSI